MDLANVHTIQCLFSLSLSLCVFVACQPAIPAEIEAFAEQLPAEIDYNYHVRPILSEHCFSCHGPDENKREANLRLDLAEEAHSNILESGKVAIQPRSLGNSEVFHRITSEEVDYKMPPDEAKIPLTNQQKAILLKWIKQGANYKPHWAFVKPVQQNTESKPKTDWTQNKIDEFVFTRLEKENLAPAQQASKETLIRRVAFDLTGLPPTITEIDEFLADDSPEAYENLVERSLASPAYGERMAAYWMDVARYADSDGYLDDKHRDFSPYRDWVIEAFNENMPYDRFVSLQVAGDLMPDAGMDEILPTAFNRLHKKNSEAGIDLEEFRVEYVADKTNTFGKAFMGLTMECARCHAHKYDPISHEDYYSLFAFFNQTDEIGHAVYGPDITPGPALLLADEEVQQQIEFIQQQLSKQEVELTKLKATLRTEANSNQYQKFDIETIKEGLAKKKLAHYSFDTIINSAKDKLSPNLVTSQPPAKIRDPFQKEGVKGKALFNTDYSLATLGEKVGWFERTDPFTIDFWVYPDTTYTEASVFLHCEDWRLGYKGYSMHLENNHLKFQMSHAYPQNALEVKTKKAIPPKTWTHVTLSYDGSSKANGVRIYLNGQLTDLQTNKDNLYKGILYEYSIHTYGFIGFQLGKRDGNLPMVDGGIDELQIFNGQLSALEVLLLHDESSIDEVLEHPQKSQSLKDEWQLSQMPSWIAMQTKLSQSRGELNELTNAIPEIMVMKELPVARPTFVLNRGNYDSPTTEVNPTTPAHILPFPKEMPANRLGLAQWLFHPDHPLTARVMVNRIWEMHFGKGLVSTQEDFGNQGALPTHPALLDWLAVWFQESGWDIKALHKLIVMSATYQQSSAISQDALAADPENKLLARGARFRFSAEMIRDNALAISGLLAPKIGGPSVYPYQPEGIWDDLSNKSWRYPYLQQPGEGLYRRSLYTVWKRTAPPPSMLLFDANDRSGCTVQRKNSSTPLQALVLLNDPQYIEAARILAEQTMQQFEGVDKQIEHAFRATTGRHPDQQEVLTLNDLYQKEQTHYAQNENAALDYLGVGELERNQMLNPAHTAALAVTINALMNTDEAYTRK